MAQLVLFRKIGPSWYRVPGKGIYGYLPAPGAEETLPGRETSQAGEAPQEETSQTGEVPQGETSQTGEASQEETLHAEEILGRGGTLLYLKKNREGVERELAALMAELPNEPGILFLTNGSESHRHWGVARWRIEQGRMLSADSLPMGDYLLAPRTPGRISCGEEGLAPEGLILGRGCAWDCRDALFVWDGSFRFTVAADDGFMKEAALCYERWAYDALTQRHVAAADVTATDVAVADVTLADVTATDVTVADVTPADVTATVAPAAAERAGRLSEKERAFATARGCFFWDEEGIREFTFPRGTALSLGEMEFCMEELELPVLEGEERSFLGIRGRGVCSRDVRVPLAGRGEFQASRGDGVAWECEMRRGADEGRAAVCPDRDGGEGEGGERAGGDGDGGSGDWDFGLGDVVTARWQAPFVSGEIRMECRRPVPLPPGRGWPLGAAAETLLGRRLRDGCVFAKSANLQYSDGPFGVMMYRGVMRWLNLYGGSRDEPGIALCAPERELAVTLAWERCFAVLDAGSTRMFEQPYTIDGQRLERAVALGYPREEARRLADCYPAGRTFLGAERFCRGVQAAECSCGGELAEACHHFQIVKEGRWISFSPEKWSTSKTVMAVRRGGAQTLSELLAEERAWDIAPGNRREAGETLAWAEERAIAAGQGEVFLQPGWEGTVVAQPKQAGEEAFVLILPAAGGGAKLL